MSKWIENCITGVVVLIATALSVGLCFGFYYLIMLMVKKVFF